VWVGATVTAGGAVVRLSIGTPSARKVNEEWVEDIN
jgi:hypothetical protein